MTSTRLSGAATGAATRSRPRAALPALCVTQITSWGIVYYAFPVLTPHITADTGWTTAQTTSAFTAALLVSALVGITVGRIIDRRGPRTVMTTGSVVGALALIGIATAPNLPLFFGSWLLAGAAMAATFYQPAFAALTRWHQPQHVRALTTVTLAGGLASTVFAPITAVLADQFGWRTTYLVLAAALAAVTVPLHALALRHPWPPAGPHTATKHPASTPDDPARTRQFLLAAVAFTLSGFAMYGVVFNLIPLLLERGVGSTTAAWALGLGGLGQTLGRTLYATLARHTSVTVRTVALISASGATTALLAAVPGPTVLLIAIAILAGTIRGNLTLLQATAVTDRWGTTSYGRLSALLAAPATIAGALAPWATSALVPFLGGYPALFTALAVIAVVAAAVASTARPRPQAS
ncbi:MFS transporter [Kitasatospora sp. NPDC093806]|uniref:MFS transporter n=1 Tax=Kitasatospora sp. NPDC093806 TaxID=3155075 RepID=UPI003430136D